jgi:transposase InsO family protein
MYESRLHIWDPPYLFRICFDGFLRRCISAKEDIKIIERCHSSQYGGHFGTFCIHAKIWQSRFFWPTIYEDTKDFIRRYGACWRHGNINSRDTMPLTNNLQIELFDVWRIDYRGLFPKSKNYEYILVAVDYASKWVEAIPCRPANAKNSKKIFEEIIFPRFRVPRMAISDGGTHFIDKSFHKYLMKHGIRHNVATPYHPQTSGQVETSNKQIKNILQKTVDEMGTAWKD